MRAARLAFAFRQTFHKDVVIDLVCYRKHGHNEGDDPSYTQPLMYQRIEAKRSVRKLYTETLVRRGDITLEEAESALDDFNAKLQTVLDEVRGRALAGPDRAARAEPAPAEDAPSAGDRRRPRRAARPLRRSCARCPTASPSTPSSSASSPSATSWWPSGQVDWALAEALAIGSLMYEGVNVRLTGQDTRRGTFSQRHAVLVDYANGEEYVPLAHIRDGLHRIGAGPARAARGRWATSPSATRCSPSTPPSASSTATRSRRPRRWWPGRRSSATSPTGRRSSSTTSWWRPRTSGASTPAWCMLLPHGYEGQGPEHSSSRFERFLSLCARGNLRVTVPSTVGPVLPPAALPGAADARSGRSSSSRPSRCCGPTRRARPFGRARVGLLPARDRRRDRRGPRDGPPHRAVQREDRPRGGAAPGRARRRRRRPRSPWSGSSSSTRGRCSS